mmetsp:Transcript_23449/g.63012  ORF Transcript_23449/g.63012 Transcript_23449/m.63012 type:complete len:158 (-) Transcript_23449:769-1242(-)
MCRVFAHSSGGLGGRRDQRHRASLILQHPGVCPFPEAGGDCTTAGQNKVVDFLACSEGMPYDQQGTTDFADTWPCADELFSDDENSNILSCYDPDNAEAPAVALIDQMQNITDSANPAVTYFPDVRIDGVQYSGSSSYRLVKTICDAYTGANKPAAC